MTHDGVRSAVISLVIGVAAAAPAVAVPIFSQTPTIQGVTGRSDVHVGILGEQTADDLTLAAADTARSVTWRGLLFPTDTITVPISFDLIFYSDLNFVPNHNDVLSTTSVTFTSLDDITDTGLEVNGRTLYEFQANLTPTALPATRVWFSVLGDTTNDSDDNFFWASGYDGVNFDTTAYRTQVTNNGAFQSSSQGPQYFILDNEQVPEPTTLAVAALLGVTGACRRRRA